jgi:hypothetical protein
LLSLRAIIGLLDLNRCRYGIVLSLSLGDTVGLLASRLGICTICWLCIRCLFAYRNAGYSGCQSCWIDLCLLRRDKSWRGPRRRLLSCRCWRIDWLRWLRPDCILRIYILIEPANSSARDAAQFMMQAHQALYPSSQ